MATIQEIIDKNRPVTEIISDLKEKAVYVQPWTCLLYTSDAADE